MAFRQWGMNLPARIPYDSDVSDGEWAFCAPYLTLMDESAPQRLHDLRALFDGVRFVVRTGSQWRLMPHDLPPWAAVYQQMRRWAKAGVFEEMAHELRAVARIVAGRDDVVPTAVILDSRTLHSTPESGARAGYDAAKRRKGSKVHIAVDTLGHLLALHVTPADEQDRAQVSVLSAASQTATGHNVQLGYVDQGYTGEHAAAAAKAHGLVLQVVKHTVPTVGFVVLPRRWVVERSHAWTARLRRLARDYERLSSTLVAFHWFAFAGLLLARIVKAYSQSA